VKERKRGKREREEKDVLFTTFDVLTKTRKAKANILEKKAICIYIHIYTYI